MGVMALLGLGYSSNAYAAGDVQNVQQATKKITGTVVDAQGPVIGASVMEKGTTNGTVTDFDGNFTLNVNPGATIVLSYIGYETQEIVVGNQSNFNITLNEDDAVLEEVVVVGYGTMKKKLVTGATVQVKGDDIAKLNTTNALEAMQSSTPGVNITQSSSQPGKGYKVFIRGAGTIGDSQPLYVIDGVAGGNLDGINPNDIESIDVLKDAASAAIYGSRAANGVILVTTKQGKEGKIEITYNGAIGWSNVAKRPQLLNAPQFLTIMDEYLWNTSGQKHNFTDFMPQYILDKVANGWEGTDWWGAFENKNAVQHNHSVTLTGGTDRSKFMMSYTFTGNEGIMGADKASYYKRHTIRINSDHVLLKAKDFDAITIGENISIGYNKNHDLAEDGMYWSYIHSLLQTNPLVPQYDDNGDNYTWTKYGAGWNGYWFNNPWEGLQKGGFNSMAEYRGINASATAFMVVQPIKGLRWRSQFNYNWGSGAYRNFAEPRSTSDGSGTVTTYNVSQNSNLNTSWSIENTITYDLPMFGAHKISAMVGQSFQSSGWSFNLAGSNSVNQGSQYATLKDWNSAWLSNFSTDLANATLSGNPNDEEYLASWFGRVNYDWNETYMATVTVRYDGSSIFADGKRWGFFPSVSAGWVITNEKFMEKTQNWLDFFKIRASWGQNGNCNISNFQYVGTIAFDDPYYFESKDNPGIGAYPNILPNKDVKWETSEQLDLGFDARFLRNRLGVAFDWYNKKTKDWLVRAPMLLSYGTGAPYVNGGDIQNKGYEVQLSWNDKIGKDFIYSVSFNFSHNKNEVTRLANSEGIIHGGSNAIAQNTAELYRLEVGYPIGYFWGYAMEGIIQNEADLQDYINRNCGGDKKNSLQGESLQPGDVKFKDVNGNGKIDTGDADKTMIGDPNPDYTVGLNINISYKGFDLGLNGYGSFGQQVAKSYRQFSDHPDDNYCTDVYTKYWTGEGSTNQYPRFSDGKNVNMSEISRVWIEDADFFKISRISFGYDFKKLYKKLPLEKCRLYVSLSNYFCFTSYSGMDPEVGFGNGASWASGIDCGYYPSSRAWQVGLNINF